MRNKILSVVALGALLAACETAPTTDKEGQNVNVGAASAPGTPEDFKTNIKDRVFFGFNKYILSSDAKKTLEAQAGWLKTYPNTKATIEGHCDKRGTREYNLALGERRASTTRNELTKSGVAKDRMKVISYGKDRLQDPGDTEEAHAKNRTAITVIE